MQNEVETLLLKAVLEQYAVPDPKIVNTMQRNGQSLSYVSHAEITRILIEIDPLWSWEPIEWVNGRPAIHVENGMATMWGRMTLLGKPMVCVGSAKTDKADYEKELIGDLLRNGSMRYGICLSLWLKQEQGATSPFKPALKAVSDAFPGSTTVGFGNPTSASKATPARQASAGNPISEKQLFLINKLSKEQHISDLLIFAAQIVGRELNAINAVNSREASQIIDRLMNPQPVAVLMEEDEPF